MKARWKNFGGGFKAPKASISSTAGGSSGACIASSDGSSGHSSLAERRSTASPKSSGDALGYAVIQGYGLTETTSIISVNHPFRLGKGSIGKVLAGREVKLAADGEILVRGSGVAAGYWTGHEPQPMADEEGWYGTGDIGELDAQGNLYFKGRKKDVIVTPAGMNVYPEDLEAALRRQPEVKDCVVIALPRDGNAEPCAVLILRASDIDPEPVVMRANETLAEYQRMRHLVRVARRGFSPNLNAEAAQQCDPASRASQAWRRIRGRDFSESIGGPDYAHLGHARGHAAGRSWLNCAQTPISRAI